LDKEFNALPILVLALEVQCAGVPDAQEELLYHDQAYPLIM
jgi:hypothetical protein